MEREEIDLYSILKNSTFPINILAFHLHKLKKAELSRIVGEIYEKPYSIWNQLTSKIYRKFPLTLYNLVLFKDLFSLDEMPIIISRKASSTNKINIKMKKENNREYLCMEIEHKFPPNNSTNQDNIDAIWLDMIENNILDKFFECFKELSRYHSSKMFINIDNVNKVVTNILDTRSEKIDNFFNISDKNLPLKLRGRFNCREWKSLYIGILTWPWKYLIYDIVKGDDQSIRLAFLVTFYKNGGDIKEEDVFKFLDSSDFYKLHLTGLYKLWELEENKVQIQSLKTSIISIIVDSFAHNVSSHSLAALEWWFAERCKSTLEQELKVQVKEIAVKHFETLQPVGLSFEDIKCITTRSERYHMKMGLDDSEKFLSPTITLLDFIRHMDKKFQQTLLQYESLPGEEKKDENSTTNEKKALRFPAPLDFVFWRFIRFLRDKAAFWGGVTRDLPFGGMTKSWFNVLWDDFANNPLFLGTIAHSEGRNIVQINLDILDEEGRIYLVDRDGNIYGCLLTGKKIEILESKREELENKDIFVVDVTGFDNTTHLKVQQVDEQMQLVPIKQKGLCVADQDGILKKVDEKNGELLEWDKIGCVKLDKKDIKIGENVVRARGEDLKNAREKGKTVKCRITELGSEVFYWSGDKLESKENSVVLFPASGDFVVIDLSLIDSEFNRDNNNKPLQDEGDEGNKDYSIYAMTKPGRFFLIFKRMLSKNAYNVFFPGGIVGEHAFFTLLENTLRNIKHIDDKDEENDKDKKSLQLGISIQNQKLRGNNNSREIKLFRVGMWLDHNTDLIETQSGSKKGEGEHEGAEPVILKLAVLTGKSVNEKGVPRLGGNSQDKICAGMLLNNYFIQVEDKNSPWYNDYFPWLHFSSFDGKKEEDMSSEINKDEYIKKYTQPGGKSKKGKIKKYIHLWKSENVYSIPSREDIKRENISRFKFLVLRKDDKELYEAARKSGIIRILHSVPAKQPVENEAYFNWLKIWEKEHQNVNIAFYLDNDIFGYLIRTDNAVEYIRSSGKDDPLKQSGDINLHFKHSDKSKLTPEESCSVRSHGHLAEYFFRCRPDEFNNVEPDEIKELYELYEVIKTRVAVFDDRLYERIPPKKIDLLKNQLRLEIFPEEVDKWRTLKSKHPDLTQHYHFIIIHLSFIEGMKKNGINYSEDTFEDFISSEIFAGKKESRDLPENFILVITTGRGRSAWWRNIEESDYKKITIFKPVEALLTAVEDGVLLKDDFQVKYNLVKALFGS